MSRGEWNGAHIDPGHGVAARLSRPRLAPSIFSWRLSGRWPDQVFRAWKTGFWNSVSDDRVIPPNLMALSCAPATQRVPRALVSERVSDGDSR